MSKPNRPRLPRRRLRSRRSPARPGATPVLGFTAIELIAVVSTLLLLTLLIIPAMARTKPSSRLGRCQNNLQQLQRAQASYAAENHGRLVPSFGEPALDYSQWSAGWLDWNTGTPTGANTNTAYLVNAALGPYIGRSADLFKCPSDTFPSLVGPRVRSYSMNAFAGTNRVAVIFGYTAYRCYLKESSLTAPGPAATWSLVDEHPDSLNDSAFLTRMPLPSQWPAPVVWDDVPASLHFDGANLSFFDGHVETRRWLDANTRVPVRKVSPSSATGKTSPNDSQWLVARTSAPL